MGFRFRKSFKVGKGVKLNVGKKSIGISAGGKRGGISINSRSGTTARISAPGTGMTYTTKLSGRNTAKRGSRSSDRTCADQSGAQYTASHHAPEAKKRSANPHKPPKSPKVYLSCGIIMVILGALMLFLFWPVGLLALGIGVYYISCGPKIYAKLVENYQAVHPEFEPYDKYE